MGVVPRTNCMRKSEFEALLLRPQLESSKRSQITRSRLEPLPDAFPHGVNTSARVDGGVLIIYAAICAVFLPKRPNMN
jgi:hypothetical protein